MAKRQGKTQIDATTSAGQAVCLLMRRGAAEFGRQLTGMMTSDDIEGPHKSRVALRRLRVAASAFKPIIAKARYRKLQDRLKYCFRTISLLRDADVLAHDLGGPELYAAATKVRAQVRADLTKAHAGQLAAAITKWFAGTAWRRKGHDAKSARKALAAQIAARALRDSWQTCSAFRPDLTTLAAPIRHELRKALKTLRYLSDHFAGLWPGPPHDAFLAALRVLQDDLGTLNDQEMARARGFLVDADPQTLARAQTHWASLLALPPWWPQQAQT